MQAIVNVLKTMLVEKSEIIREELINIAKYIFENDNEIFLTINYYSLLPYPSITYIVSILFDVISS